MALCCYFVSVDVQLGIRGEFGVRDLVVLVAFNPLNAKWSPEFLMEFSNDREEVVIVWLLGRPIVRVQSEDHSVYGNSAINDPSEFATVSKPPVSCDQSN